MNRYFIELAYNGSNYHGWQIQPNAVTIQEVLEGALSTVYRQKIHTTGCGRTDTGVHATQFFAHFDTGELLEGPDYLTSINALLPYEIAVKNLFSVEPNAHARFDATLRSYQYHIHFKKDPFKQGFSWKISQEPNIADMNLAAAILMDYHDFSCFSKSHTQVQTNNCVISRAEWISTGHSLVFHISADRFLRNMVRAIVGTLLDIGQGKLKPEMIRAVIESKKRSNAGTSVPACGLYLTELKYPFNLPKHNG